MPCAGCPPHSIPRRPFLYFRLGCPARLHGPRSRPPMQSPLAHYAFAGNCIASPALRDPRRPPHFAPPRCLHSRRWVITATADGSMYLHPVASLHYCFDLPPHQSNDSKIPCRHSQLAPNPPKRLHGLTDAWARGVRRASNWRPPMVGMSQPKGCHNQPCCPAAGDAVLPSDLAACAC